jgi:pyruvate kinase
MPIKTKIVCTMGPAVASKEKILQLIDVGMNVARLNFSHGTQEEHHKVIELLKEARSEKKVPLAIMIDTKGPEIRVGIIREGEIELKAGQNLILSPHDMEGTIERISIHPPQVLKALEPGMKLLFDDGHIICQVVEKRGEEVVVQCKNSGSLKTHKGVNVPGVDIELPSMTEQDIDDITFGCRHDIDIIAASFVRAAQDVLEIKKLLIKLGKPHIIVLAKIESRLGVINFQNIVQVADGIMVARGDLGVELPLEQVPILQKMMIRHCNEACKPVITATQMLESMTKNPRPTRAEVSDVANAIYDSTSAVMLSGETAVGTYPIETVTMMRKIIEEAEKDCDYRAYFQQEVCYDCHNISLSVALASVQTAYTAGAKAIFASSNSGFTVRLISRFRPAMPIYAQTSNERIYHQLAIHWGVYPIPPMQSSNIRETVHACGSFALEQGVLRWGDLIVLTAGSPFGVSGTTNIMMLENIGDVLVRGYPGLGKPVVGKVVLIISSTEKNFAVPKGSIVVMTSCDPEMAPLLQGVKGIILQNSVQDPDSESCALMLAQQLGLAVVLRAAGAFNNLHDGMVVTIDPLRGLVFKGELAS